MPEEGVQLSPKHSLMSAEEIYDIARIFVDLGVNKIRLTGGEPLLRKDTGKIMSTLSQLPVSLTMTTNGVLVDRYLNAFKLSGIRSLNLSLDTLNENRYFEITKRNIFQKVISNINLLLDNGFKVKVNVVLIRDFNDDEILDFIKWTKNENIHVRFIEFMPFDDNQWRWEKIFSYKEILEEIKSVFEIQKLKDKKHDTARAFQVIGYKGTFAIISSMTNHFCGTCSRLRLTADGKMKNCLFSNDEVDLLTPFRSGEDIKPIIRECLWRKKPRHGGIKELEKLTINDPEISQRSMILIGG